MLSRQPILWAKSTSDPHLALRVIFATRAAPPAHDNKVIAMQGAGKQKLPNSMDAGEPLN